MAVLRAGFAPLCEYKTKSSDIHHARSLCSPRDTRGKLKVYHAYSVAAKIAKFLISFSLCATRYAWSLCEKNKSVFICPPAHIVARSASGGQYCSRASKSCHRPSGPEDLPGPRTNPLQSGNTNSYTNTSSVS